jgi:predicted secreted protein
MGDDLVETFPTYIVTTGLSDAIASSGLSGIELDDVLVTKDPQFEQFFPDVAAALPSWRWLRPVGTPHQSDFWQDEAGRLVLSEKALDILQRFQLANAEVVEL